MAVPQGAQSAILDAFLGLLTNVAPESLPEGSTSLTWDTDYIVGNVHTRPGLVSYYSFCTGA